MKTTGDAYLSFPYGASPLRKQRFFGDSDAHELVSPTSPVKPKALFVRTYRAAQERNYDTPFSHPCKSSTKNEGRVHKEGKRALRLDHLSDELEVSLSSPNRFDACGLAPLSGV